MKANLLTIKLRFFTVALLFSPLSLLAAEKTWTGGTSADWDNAGNWTPSAFATGDSVLFNNLSTSNLSTNNDLVGITVDGITVLNPGNNVSIGGNAIDLSGGIDLSNATRNLTLSVANTVTAAQTWNVADGRTITQNGLLTLTDAEPLQFLGGGNIIVSDVVASADAVLNLNGSGRFTISTESAGFSGVINLNSGQLGFEGAFNPAQGSNFVINGNGGDLYLNRPYFAGSRTISATLNVNEDISLLTNRSVRHDFNQLNIENQTLTLETVESPSNPDSNARFNNADFDGNATFQLAPTSTLQLGTLSASSAGSGLTVVGGGRLYNDQSNWNALTGTIRLEGGSTLHLDRVSDSFFGNATLDFVDGTFFFDTNGSRNYGNTTILRGEMLSQAFWRGGSGGTRTATFGELTVHAGASFEHIGDAAQPDTSVLGIAFGETTFLGGASEFAVATTGSTNELTLGNTWNRNDQATTHFALGASNANIFSNPASLASSGILGFATVNNSFASLEFSQIVPLADGSYNTLPSGGVFSFFTYETTGSLTMDAAANQEINALRIDNAATGALDINNGTLALASGGLLFIGSENYSIENGQIGATNAEVIIHQRSASANLSVSAQIGGGTGQLTKTGVGTLLISTPQNFTGQTAINQGTLELIGTGGLAGDVLVQATGTLAGTGIIDGDVTVLGTLAPGNSPGTLTLDNTNLTLVGSDALVSMDIEGLGVGEFDRVVGIDLLTYAGELVISLSGTYNVNDSWSLLDFANHAGHFDSVVLTGDYTANLTRLGNIWSGSDGGLDWEFSQSTGVLSVIPEPSTAGLLAVGLAALFLRRRASQKR